MQNNTLSALTAQASQGVISAIEKASHATGVDFAYLVQQAKVESSFNPTAKAKTSSATGLFQFIEKTWLSMVKEHGHKYGMGDLAAKIDDKCCVSDPAVKKQILDLRKDPEKASLLAAEFANENKAYLERHVGGEIGATELYLAHFLGAGGAAGFLNAMKKDPMTVGAHILPKAAAANRPVFYDVKTRQPKTLQQIYASFDTKFEEKISESDSQVAYSATVTEVKTVNTEPKSYHHIPPSLQKPITFENRHYDIGMVQSLLQYPSKSLGFIGDSRHPANLYTRVVLSPVDILNLYKTSSEL